jgi:anti-sigma regulatory factor (Ser/Thr protein kinase)
VTTRLGSAGAGAALERTGKSARTRFNSPPAGNTTAVPAFELEIAARPSEVGRVRRAIRAAVVRYGLDESHADVMQLVASELVMNAVLHGGPPVVVRLEIERDSTLLEVYDGGAGLPELGPDDDPAHARRGLRVVEGMCSDWGTVPGERGGKTVWCVISHGTAATGPVEKRRRAADEPAY